MGWGFDFGDVGDLLSDLGSSVVDAGKEIVSDIELSDALAIGTVASSVYFANENLKQQEEALKSAQQQAVSDMATDPVSLASNPEADQAVVDIGESDIVTEEDYEESLEESRTNVGKIRKSKPTTDSATPKKKQLLVPQKSGVIL